MKKFFLLPLLLTATMVFADDAVLVESFSEVVQTGSSGTAGATWTGDVCTWTNKYARRGTNDLINGKQATWITMDPSVRGYIKTTNLEGGVKSVSFDYAQFGAEAATTLKWKVTAGSVSDTIVRDGDNGGNKDNPDTYSHNFACKSNAQFEIFNVSMMENGDAPASGKARLLVGDITITPYLLYTTKEDTLDLRLGSNTFTNAGLINNTEEGTVVYSISDNTIGATIDAATGEVTASQAGEVTVTASWEEITTSYTLTILAKDVATASFENNNVLAKLGEAAPTNTFTTNSNASVEFVSSDENVATIDNAGHVTIVGVGTTTITANVPENDSYTSASATYTLRVVPDNFKIETFDSAEETTSNYANPAESTTGDICQWTAQLGGVKHMTDNNYIPMFGDTKYALFRAPRQGEEKVSYIESASIAGGIEYLTFQVNPTAGEGSTTWDIRVFVNGVQVGENYSAIPTAPQAEWTTITIPNIKVAGSFVLRFENHSTLSTTYTSGNKGRLAIDNIEWVGYEGAPSAINYIDATREIRKEMINGQLIINIDGVRYNMQGQQL